MPKRISEAVRSEARARWIRGGCSDEALARELGIRPATLRAWKQRENWPGLRDQVHGIVDDEVQIRVMKARADLDRKHDGLAEALEGMIVRAMRERAPDGSPTLDPAGIRALASALAATQRVRRVATGADRLPQTAAEFGPTKIIFEPAVPPPGSGRESPETGADPA